MTSDLNNRVDELASQLRALSTEVQGNDEERKKLLGAAGAAMGQLETPLETLWRIEFQPHSAAALMALIDMGAIHELVVAGKPVSAGELAKATGGEELLIVRLMRALVPMNYVKEVDEELYEALPFVKLFEDPTMRGGYTIMHEVVNHSLSRMPSYLQSNGYRNISSFPGPFQHAKQTDQQMFPWLINNPVMMYHFNKFMVGQRQQRVDWFKELPLDEMFLNGAKADADAGSSD